MTSIRMPYVNPYPVECLKCGGEMTEDDVESIERFRRKKREIQMNCSECNNLHEIVQRPLDPEYEISIIDE
jgi:hypothetical protein